MAEVTPESVRSMSVPERILLVERIWDDIAEDVASMEPTASQKQELERRLASIAADPGRGATWDEVKARLHQRQ